MSTSDPSLRDQGIEALRARDFDRAIDLLARAVMADDGDADSKALLGVAYSQKGLHTQAKRALQAAVDLQPQNANFRFNLGVALERAGDSEGAAAAYRETLQLNKDHAQARAKLQALGPQAHAAPANLPRHPDAGAVTASGPSATPFRPSPTVPPPGAAPAPPPPPVPPPAGSGISSPPPVPPPGPPPRYGAPPAGASAPADAGAATAYAPPPQYTPPPQYAPPPGAGAAGYAPPGSAAGPGYPPGMAAPAAAGTVRCTRCGQWSRPGMACEWCASPLPGAPLPYAAGGAPVYTTGAGYSAAPPMTAGDAFFRRFAAAFIDNVVVGLVACPLAFSMGLVIGLAGSHSSSGATGTEAVAQALGTLLELGLRFLYSGFMLSTRGQTLGKMALSLRVVGPDGGNPSFWRAGLRDTLGKTLSSCVCALGFLWMLWDPEQKTWHDKICDTRVERA